MHLRDQYDPEWEAKWDWVKAQLDAGYTKVPQHKARWLRLPAGSDLEGVLGPIYDRQFRTPLEFYLDRQRWNGRYSKMGRRVPFEELGDDPSQEEVDAARERQTALRQQVDVLELALHRLGQHYGVFDEPRDGRTPERVTVRVPTDDASARTVPVSVEPWNNMVHIGIVDSTISEDPMDERTVVALVNRLMRDFLIHRFFQGCTERPSFAEWFRGLRSGPRMMVWVHDALKHGGRCRTHRVLWTKGGTVLADPHPVPGPPWALVEALMSSFPQAASIAQHPRDKDAPNVRYQDWMGDLMRMARDDGPRLPSVRPLDAQLS